MQNDSPNKQKENNMKKTNNRLVKAKRLLECIKLANESIENGDYINSEFNDMIEDLNEIINDYKLEDKSFMWLAESLINTIENYKDSWQETSDMSIRDMINDWYAQNDQEDKIIDPREIDLTKVPEEIYNDLYDCYYGYESGYDWNSAEEALYELDSYGFWCTMLGY